MKARWSSMTCRLRTAAISLILVASSSVYAAPSTPEGFRFEVYSKSTIELFWDRSTGGSLAVGYELTKNGEVLGQFDALSYTDITLLAGVPYEYSITAIDAGGYRSETVTSTVLISTPTDQIETLQRDIAALRALLSQNYPGPVAATGQTASVRVGDDTSTLSGIAVVGERFKDNNDGTFTDLLTGITWLGVRDCIVRRVWNEAIDYANAMADDGVTCAALSDGSVATDWRLPTIKELQSLLDVTKDSPAFADGIPYQGSWSENPWTTYWSSSSFGPAPHLNGWLITADYGTSFFTQKSNVAYSWPIKVQLAD